MKIRTKTAVAVACAVFSAGYPGAVPAYAEDAGFDIGTYLGITGGVSGNAVYSPASLSMALGLAASGANGDTAASMKKLLLGREKAEAADLPEFYSAFSGRIAAIGRRGDVDLVCANSLWTDVSFEIKPPFKTLAADSFGAGVSSVDLAMSGAAEINAWVTAKTKGMIKKIVDDLNNARMVIVNAVYFKGEWRFPFEASRTRPRPFRSGNEVKNVPAMSQTENFAYAKKDGFTALKMPYKDAAVSMLILLPDADDGLESLEKSLTE